MKIWLLAFTLLYISACDFRLTRDPDVLVWHFDSNPSTLNPLIANDAVSFTVFNYIYEPLLDLDNETLEPRPKLASHFSISADHLSYRFTIRDNIKWHDGVPFTVDDVIYTFEKIKDPNVDAGHWRSYFADVTSIKKIDEHTVEFTYSRPYFKGLTICGGLPIIPKHIFDNGTNFNSHAAGRKPIGTGPFKFKSWANGQKIELERNDDYWGEKSKIKGIIFKIIPNPNVAFQLLKKGGIDFAGLRPIQWARQTETPNFVDRFDKYRQWLPNYSFVGWNMNRPFFSDKRVRVAMTMLIDRETILKEVLFGQGEVVSASLYRFGRSYDESIKPYPYDPQKAAELLDESGWTDHDKDGLRDKDGIPFSFTFLMVSGDRFSKNLGLILRHDLAKVGIDVKLNTLEWGTVLGMVQSRNFDSICLQMNGSFEDDPYQLWHSSQAEKGSNFFGFKNKSADTLIERGREEFDIEARAKIYRELHRLIHEEEPCTFLFTTPTLIAVAKRFTNVIPYKTSFNVLEWKVRPWPPLTEW